jgi:hypothetical protein
MQIFLGGKRWIFTTGRLNIFDLPGEWISRFQ